MSYSESQTALAAAIANEATQLEKHQQNVAALAAAVAATDALIASAASGAAVKSDDVMKARAAAQTALAAAELSASVHAGSKTLRHRAEIEKWHSDAAALAEAAESALVERISTGRAVDEARAALESALTKFHEAGDAFENARRAVGLFNADTPARLAVNPVLAAAPQGSGPQARAPHNAKVRRLELVIFEKSGWIDVPKTLRDIASGEASLAGRRDLLPTA